MSKKNDSADPTRLKPFDVHEKQLLRVIIETPKGSRNKFAFNADEHAFELKKVLPSGMTFPYDFGFVPSTKTDDGDPVDVLVISFWSPLRSKVSGCGTHLAFATSGSR